MVEEKKEIEVQQPNEVVVTTELAEVPVVEEVPEIKLSPDLERWKPKTSLGQEVFNGKITNIDDVLKSGRRIAEPEIIDMLVPNIKNELILIGGRAGKGGGIQRIPVRITAAMHKSGRRFTTSAYAVVGNEDGLVGIGQGRAPETRDAIAKAIQRAKLNLLRIKLGCGSWECDCGTNHSVPYKITGKSGSVRFVLQPAPKGVGLVANDESKKIFRLAGIKDAWVKTFGNTSMRINLISAIYDALKKLYVYERVE
ncbi:MAG: 30S ribosomal protein S5 [Candidatus Aenigmarchaeota archaeon]|nr:30S ribosomal protein S5 [Candidatus Aenigmarchaeota archaeon]